VDTQKLANGESYQGVCMTRPCWNSSTSCDCMRHKDCFWFGDNVNGQCRNNQYYNIPPTDLIIFLDASSNMNKRLGRYPNGYIGALGLLQNWIDTLPLTGTKSGNNNVDGQAGMRLMIYQFCGRSVYSSVTQMSGDRLELLSILQWHETNRRSTGSSCLAQPAVKAAADMYQLLTGINPNRKRLAAWISNSEFSDSSSLRVGGLAALEARLYVATIRPVPDVTQASSTMLENNAKLTDNTYNIQITEVVSAYLNNVRAWAFNNKAQYHNEPVTFLNDDITGACSMFQNNSLLCNRDESCLYQPTRVCRHPTQCPNLGCQEPEPSAPYKPYRCENCITINTRVRRSYFFNLPVFYNQPYCSNSVCTSYCDQAGCNTNPDCYWNFDKNYCYRKVCNYTDPTSCKEDWACAWNANKSTCRLNLCTDIPDSGNCTAKQSAGGLSQCLWDLTTLIGPKCKENPCMYPDPKSCIKAPSGECMWDPNAQDGAVCRRKSCLYDTENSCIADDVNNCEWVIQPYIQPFCRQALCAYTNMSLCAADNRCRVLRGTDSIGTAWSACREQLCSYNSSIDCNADKNCYWNATDLTVTPQGTCYEAPCAKLPNEVLCGENPACMWDFTRAPSMCTITDCARFGGTQSVRRDARPVQVGHERLRAEDVP